MFYHFPRFDNNIYGILKLLASRINENEQKDLLKICFYDELAREMDVSYNHNIYTITIRKAECPVS